MALKDEEEIVPDPTPSEQFMIEKRTYAKLKRVFLLGIIYIYMIISAFSLTQFFASSLVNSLVDKDYLNQILASWRMSPYE